MPAIIFLLLVCTERIDARWSVILWWMKKVGLIRLPTVLDFTQLKIEKFKVEKNAVKGETKSGWCHSQITQLDKSLHFLYSICGCERRAIACHKINSIKLESVRSSNNGWEPPIIQQKNSIRTVYTYIVRMRMALHSPWASVFTTISIRNNYSNRLNI